MRVNTSTDTPLLHAGKPLPLGVTIVGQNTLNFAIYSENATDCKLLLFHKGEEKPFWETNLRSKHNNTFCVQVQLPSITDVEYCYQMDGPVNPAQGLRFNKNAVLLDPYAKGVDSRTKWGEPIPERVGRYRGEIYQDDFDWEGDTYPRIPRRDFIIYETHVRTMTMHVSSNVENPGTYAGIIEKIPYLKKLGINCLELLPVYEFDEVERERFYEGKRLYNYWGYSTVNFFSPKSTYAVNGGESPQHEFKRMVKELHKNGIKLLLDVVYNHTFEGEGEWQTFSFRGIDDKTYYITMPDGRYGNFTGCGNTFNCNHPMVSRLIIDSLRWWHTEYHVDGFRFDLAPILVRGTNSEPLWNNPLAEKIAKDWVLKDAILIAEPWDACGLYLTGQFNRWGRWSEWNDKYRNTVRQFINGDENCAPEFMQRFSGSPDLYSRYGAEGSINFLTCHDGFTLYDLVSYNQKHNMQNGENNRDGSDWNASCNNGCEGETEDGHINHMRMRKMKSMIALLMTSRGIPMMCGGDEIANTQYGNNNAYCQDGEISWIDWNRKEKFQELYDFTEKMIAFRKKHPVLRDVYLEERPSLLNYPELSFYYPDKSVANRFNHSHCIAALYAESKNNYEVKEDSFIYVMTNVYSKEIPYFLPNFEKIDWTVVDDSSTRNRPGDKPYQSIIVEPYTVVILEGKIKK